LDELSDKVDNIIACNSVDMLSNIEGTACVDLPEVAVNECPDATLTRCDVSRSLTAASNTEVQTLVFNADYSADFTCSNGGWVETGETGSCATTANEGADCPNQDETFCSETKTLNTAAAGSTASLIFDGGLYTRDYQCNLGAWELTAQSGACGPQACASKNVTICSTIQTLSGVNHGDYSKVTGGFNRVEKYTCNDGTFVGPTVTGVCDATYSWKTGSWGTCSVSCGGGTQTRSVTCERDQDGATVANSNCDAATQPSSSRACNTDACAPPPPDCPSVTISASCGTCSVTLPDGNIGDTVAEGSFPGGSCFDASINQTTAGWECMPAGWTETSCTYIPFAACPPPPALCL